MKRPHKQIRLGPFKSFLLVLKYEIKNSIKPLMLPYAIGFFSVLFCFINRNTNIIHDMISALGFFSFVAFGISLIVIMFQSFYVEIFGEQGYLSLTLPIPLDSLLLAKIVHFVLWVILSILVLVGTLVIFKYKNIELDWVTFIICVGVVLWIVKQTTIVLFIAALLNATKTRHLVFAKGCIIYIVINILMASFAGFMPIVYFYNSIDPDFSVFIYECLCLVAFYILARSLIVYRLELP